jgi:hypothetical protein
VHIKNKKLTSDERFIVEIYEKIKKYNKTN